MLLHLDREAPTLWRKIGAEMSIEVSLVVDNWKPLLAGIVFQYRHGLAAHGIHYFHRPGPTLQDTGFSFLPALGPDKAYTLHPFVFQHKKIYTALKWCGVLAYLVILRIVTFYSTHLPGPNYHCREVQLSFRAQTVPGCLLQRVIEVLIINLSNGVNYGCGDLIFSSHMIFAIVFVCTYQKYGSTRYTVNLVAFFIDKKIPELPDRSSGLTSVPMIPVTRDKDSRNMEEHHKLMSGVSSN